VNCNNSKTSSVKAKKLKEKATKWATSNRTTYRAIGAQENTTVRNKKKVLEDKCQI